jgi:molybdenum cofactor cytidylyltransferase
MTQEIKIAAIVLAAGASKRFGTADKLLAPYGPTTILGESLAAFNDAPVARKIAVIRPNDALAALCKTAGFEVVENHAADKGMGSSIATGIAALKDETHALIGLGDMPALKAESVALLCQAAATMADTNNDIALPTYQNRRGHPRLFAAAHFAYLGSLSGDEGARKLIESSENILHVPTDDTAIAYDIDTPDDLAAHL